MTSRFCFGTTSLFGAVALAALFLFAHDARAQKVDDGAEYLEDSSAAAPDDGFRPVWQQQQQALKADPLLHWVPTSHLAFEVMGSGQPHYHYGTQGQLQLGEVS